MFFAQRNVFEDRLRPCILPWSLVLVGCWLAGVLIGALPATAQSTEGFIGMTVCTKDAVTGAMLSGVTVRVRRRPRSANQPETQTKTASTGCAQVSVAVNVGADDAPDLPDAFRVREPYPNPAASRVVVPFAVPASQEVTFALYDVLGRQVGPRWQQRLPVGLHALEITLDGLADGVYLFRLAGPSGVSTGRLVRSGGERAGRPAVRLTTFAEEGARAAAGKTAQTFPVRVWAEAEGYREVAKDLDVEDGAVVTLELPPVDGPPEDLIPLIDMGTNQYLGLFDGGLYGQGLVGMPAEHEEEGIRRGQAIEPLDVDGNPDPNGHYVLMSIGFSNTTQEWCHPSADLVPCNPWTFTGKALADPDVEKEHLVIVNGAKGSEAAESWDDPAEANYDRIRDTHLTPQGLSEKQVVAIWLKVTTAAPKVSLPNPDAEAYRLKEIYADILRALKARYPNLQMVFMSSRIYGGYGNEEGVDLHPEPYAYESGLAVKWVIEAQINQMAGEGIDPDTGDLDYNTVAPWVAWGPYLWANGTTPRSDGLIWERSDFEADGTHPAQSAEEKVGGMLLDFFRAAPQTKCWFLQNAACEIDTSARTPLTELLSGTYMGFEGGLYAGATNDPPDDHAAEGLARALAIEPLDVNGNPDPNGHYVLMSIGMSNTTQEWCAPSREMACNSWSFMGQAAADPGVNHGPLMIVNGAQGGKGADAWVSADGDQYDRILEDVLTPAGLSEKQVQVIFYKNANKASGSRPSLPDPEADAYLFLENLGRTARALKTRYPNLKILFVSSRVYAGYAPITTNNPEPWAYETGFSVKWLIDAQIRQMRGEGIDPIAGDLDYTTVAPWITWGPYLWANGLTPRQDTLLGGLYTGLTWSREDFEADGSHPSTQGETKIAGILLEFFKRSPFSSCWFMVGGTCSF